MELRDVIQVAGEVAKDATGITPLVDAVKKFPAEWKGKSREGKAVTVAALSLTVSRVVVAGGQLAKTTINKISGGGHMEKNYPAELALEIYKILSDFFDGKFARMFDDGGKTTLGEVGDPLADKAQLFLDEVRLLLEGKLDPSEFISRNGRDVGVNMVRSQTTRESGGDVHVDALPLSNPLSGKYSTASRMIANLLSQLPPELLSQLPEAVRSIIDHCSEIADVHIAVSGITNVASLRRKLDEWRLDPKAYRRKYKHANKATQQKSPMM